MKKHSLLWWIAALLVGVPLTLLVLARIVMISVFVLPIIILVAVVIGFYKGLVRIK